MKGQGDWLENQPSLMLLPLLSWDGQLKWNGEPYECLVLATSSQVYCEVGANLCKEENVLSLETGRDRVKVAVDAFAQALPLFISSIMTSLVPEDATEPKKTVCRLVREYYAEQKEIVVPTLSDILEGSRTCVCVVRFEQSSIPLPGRQQTSQRNATGHPAPCPIFLSLRAVNTWIRHLHSEGELRVSGEQVNSNGAFIFLACYDMKLCSQRDCKLCWEKQKRDDPDTCFAAEAGEDGKDSIEGKAFSTPLKELHVGGVSGSSPDSTDTDAASAASRGSTLEVPATYLP